MAQELDAQDTEQIDIDAAEDGERDDRRRNPWPWIALIIVLLLVLWLLWQYLGWGRGGRSELSGVKPAAVTDTSATLPPEPVEAPAAPNPLQPRVPDVVGMSEGRAIDTLKAAGYVPVVSETYGTKYPAGIVYSQSPAGDAMLAEGGSVTIRAQVILTSAATYRMPKLVGLTKAAAMSRLSGLGITPTLSYTPVAGTHKAGTVNSQWPLPGHRVKRGGEAQIELFVDP